MRKNRKKTIRQSLLILLLLIGIGYAALRTTLKIDGTVGVDKTTWDVHFENVSVTNGSVTANPAPTSNDTDTTEMTYAVNFSQPGDYFEFTVDIVNDGSIDAMIESVSNNAYANASSTTPIAIPAYLSSTVTYDDGTPIQQNQELLHNTSEKIKVRIEFKKDINVSDLPSSGATSLVFKFNGSYKQKDENAISTYDWRLPTGRTKDNLQLGDEICTRDQCFNFLHYEGTNNEDIVMFAKYNLNVGNNAKGTETFIQDSDVIGRYRGYGTVAFSSEMYWMDGNNLLSPYNQNDTIYYNRMFVYRSDNSQAYPIIYDSSYDTAPDFSSTCDGSTNCWKTPGYSIAYYVKQYVNKLAEDYGVTIKDARLLTLSEAISNIGCQEIDPMYYYCSSTSFISTTSYWIGNVFDEGYVFPMEYGGHLSIAGVRYYDGDEYGVRPVIVVSKSDI